MFCILCLAFLQQLRHTVTKFQPSYFIALRKVPFHMPNFALFCGPLGHQDSIFISYIPDLKEWKTDMSGFWQTTGKRKFQPQEFPWKMLCQSLWQQQHCSFHYFFPGKDVLSYSRTFQEVRGCSAHPGCVYVAVRSLTDVAKVMVPQPGALHIHLLHSQSTLGGSKVAHWYGAF